jgi:hypothetical protein
MDEEPELDFVSPGARPRRYHGKKETHSDQHDDNSHGGKHARDEKHGGKKGKATRNIVKPSGTSLEQEEQKVKLATLKLVIWLRNRLRKRLNEVADLETAMKTTEHAIANLGEAQKRTAAEREHEIAGKRARQTELAEFRRTADAPDTQLRIVKEQSAKLERQLAGLGEVYAGLAAKQAGMEARLRDAGFSHWLDARGNVYMPATAVGVLAKSAEVLSPVASGVEAAVAAEQEIARELEALVPLGEGSVVPGVVSDVLVLAPAIPVVALAGRLSCSMKGLTVLHYMVYLSAVFAAQGIICVLSSVAVAQEAIGYFQRSNEPALIAVLFLTAGLYSWYVFLHALLAVVHTTHRNLAHLSIVTCIGCGFYKAVFQPAVLNHAAGLPVLAPGALAVVFLYVMTDRNTSLQLGIPFDRELRGGFDAAHAWAAETAGAMRIALVGGGGGAPAAAAEAAYERDGARARHRSYAAYYGPAGARPLAMGGSRSSAVSVATTAYSRRGRWP